VPEIKYPKIDTYQLKLEMELLDGVANSLSEYAASVNEVGDIIPAWTQLYIQYKDLPSRTPEGYKSYSEAVVSSLDGINETVMGINKDFDPKNPTELK
jgi:hypothetical protein